MGFCKPLYPCYLTEEEREPTRQDRAGERVLAQAGQSATEKSQRPSPVHTSNRISESRRRRSQQGPHTESHLIIWHQEKNFTYALQALRHLFAYMSRCPVLALAAVGFSAMLEVTMALLRMHKGA